MNEFIELVRGMRNAQKEYFKTRDKSVLLKSKELERKVDSYNFICENVQLPDVETDRLSNSLGGFTSLMEKLSKEDETVNEETEPTGEVVEEQNKEEAIPLPGSSPISHAVNNLRSILRDSNFKSISVDTSYNSSKEIFQLKRNGEALRVTIVHITTPIE